MKMYKQIIFDKDGTLLKLDNWIEIMKKRAQLICNLTNIHEECFFNELIEAMGIDPLKDILKPDGSALKKRELTAQAVVKVITGYGITKKEAELVTEKAFKQTDEIFKNRSVQLFPHTKKVLKELTKNYTLCVATSDIYAKTVRELEISEIGKYFCAIVTNDRVSTDKPSPEMVHYLCNITGIAPEYSVVVGDSIFDLIMANNAGALGIGLLSGIATEDELKSYTSIILSSIAELPGFLSYKTF